LKGRSVLIVDDNATNRLIVKRYLSGLDLDRIEEARSGSEALSKIRRNKFDIILLDFRMPGMNGLDVVKALGKESGIGKNVILLLTSDEKLSDEQELESLGISSRLVKPLYRAQLLDSIQNAFVGRAQELSKLVPSSFVIPQPANPRILVVDDMADNRLVLKSFLHESQSAIDEAEDGGQAVAMHKANLYTMIFMDLRMAPVDGYTAIESIREWESETQTKSVPIVVVTAHASQEDLDKAYLSGCSDHMIKPISRAKLAQTMKKFDFSIADSPGAKTQAENQNLEPFFLSRLGTYLENRRGDLALLKSALSEQNFEQIRKLSHHISGTAAMFGLEELGSLGHQMDNLATQGDASRVRELIQKMEFCLKKAQT
jgi:CheY-like chemotaxis protein